MTSSPLVIPCSGVRTAQLEDRMRRHRLRLRVTTSRGSSFTTNVSLAGACTEQLRVLAVGTRIEGHISLDGRDAPFSGRVAWTLAGDSRTNHLGRMGVHFERIGSELAQGLAAREARSASGAPLAFLESTHGSAIPSIPRKDVQ